MGSTIRSLRAELSRNLEYFFFEPEDIQQIIAQINSIPLDARRSALALLVQLSNTSGNIVPRVMPSVMHAVSALPIDDAKRWLGHAFALLDAEGTEPTIRFMMRASAAELDAFSKPATLRLDSAMPGLVLYLRGISGGDFPILPSSADVAYTDGRSIFLLRAIALASTSGGLSRDDALGLYRLMATFLWAEVAFGTLRPSKGHTLEALFNKFEQRGLAIDLYTLLEASRLERLVLSELPALALKPPKARALASRQPPASAVSAFVEEGYRALLGEHGHREWDDLLSAYAALDEPYPDALYRLYERAGAIGRDYVPVGPIPFVGTIRPRAVAHRAKAEREQRAERIRASIERLVRDQTIGAVPLPPREREQVARREALPGKLLLIEGKLVRVDDMAAELLAEHGGLPGILVEGEGTGGHAMDLAGYEGEASPDRPVAAETAGGIAYDEWDYKRAGYKKGWVRLHELDVHPSDAPFVAETRRRYSALIHNIRRQFELMRVVPGTLKRQPEGEDIDLDAVVESVADTNAGQSAGEGLYTRVDRRERSVAVLFLLDMSGSTKGWVNAAQREALVMMCEALDALRDKYAIYGFSGMTRNRAEFYRIKDFSEGYTGEVQSRIAGIEPKDYTRMGPAIRHSLRLLNAIEARTRLLIVLSDGRPEDYDAYKGDYGIEDTRMALIEARIAGAHPYCITIDREAPSYISRMCGERGFAMLDDVRELPARIAGLYRLLTT